MKKLLALILSFSMLVGCGGNSSSDSARMQGGILKAYWGESRDTVKAKFNELAGMRLALDSTDLVYVGGSYEGFAVETWVLSFHDGGDLWSGRIIFAADSTGGNSFRSALETKLTELYGLPDGTPAWVVKSTDGTTLSTITLVVENARTVELRIESVSPVTAQAEPVSETPGNE